MTDVVANLDRWLEQAKTKVAKAVIGPSAEQVGRVESAADGIARLSGLPDARLDELILFEGGQLGYAITLDRDSIECVLLDDPEGVEAGHRARLTGDVARAPVGPALLGRVVDPLGR